MMDTPLSPADALAKLKEGNARFANNLRSMDSLASPARRASLVGGQRPFAIILSCSDSRVPSELVFDCGLGDLFVVRVAGNVVAPSIVGSIEFAASTFGTRLVAVVGHSHCGAVKAAVDFLQSGTPVPSPNIADIVERIVPAIRELGLNQSPAELSVRATRANVRKSVDQLKHGSNLLEEMACSGKLSIVGGEYDLETGRVDFFDAASLRTQGGG